MRAESTLDVGPGLTRVNRIRPDWTGSGRDESGQTGATPEQSGIAATRPKTTNRNGSARPTLKLGTYNGTTPLETFLAKFENYSNYYGWNTRERLCHLRACLEGHGLVGHWYDVVVD